MRYTNDDINNFLKHTDPKDIIQVIEERIAEEKLALQINQILRNKLVCIEIEHRIADAEILILMIRGYLPA